MHASVIQFDPAILSGLGHRGWRSATPRFADRVSGCGPHRSRQGGGDEGFVHHRPYVGGDDLRRLDWPLLARTGRLYTRQLAQTTPMPVVLALDVSASMTFAGLSASERPAGSGSKLVFCQHLACALAHLVLRQQDRLGLALLANRLMQWIEPSSTIGHGRRIRQSLCCIRPQPAPQLAGALAELFHRAGAPGDLLILGDFLDAQLPEMLARLRLFRQARWHVTVGQVLHPDEWSLPNGGALEMLDLECGRQLACDLSSLKPTYQARLQRHLDWLERQTWAMGATFHRWNCAQPWIDALWELLGRRMG